MKTILLAVDGMAMDKKTLQYALTLCNPVRAGLDILQIIRPLADPERVGRIKNGVRRVRDAFENAWTVATYAEAGVPDLAGVMEKRAMGRVKKMLPGDIDTTVDYHCLVTGKDPDTEVIRYVDAHRNVILTIYDTLRARGKKVNASLPRTEMAKDLQYRLPVPLIFVRNV